MALSVPITPKFAAIAILCACINVSAIASSNTGGCGTSKQISMRKVSLVSMDIKTPLYVMQYSGKFLRVDPNKQNPTIISDHGFYSMPTVRPAGNGRWISYSGELKGMDKAQYWLYDRQSNTERLVYEHPAWGGGIPDFSPDSRYLAIAASYDSRWPSVRGAGIFVFDTATLSMLSVNLPTGIAITDAWASTAWSKDGKELLIMVRSMSVLNVWKYYSYRPATKRFEEISGHYNSTMHEHIFTRRLREIPRSAEIQPRSDVGLESAFSTNGNWHAYLGEENADGSYQLNVVGKDRAIKKVALGHYEQCEGKTLYITGWLDEHHLVYRESSMKFFVFDAESGSTAELIGGKDGPVSFTW